MRCIEGVRRAGWAVLLALGACSTTPLPPPEPPPTPIALPRATPTAPPVAARTVPATAVRSWDELRVQAARRMVAASPGAVYSGAVPEPLLAIPVLEIELNGDGSVRHIAVLRQPSQAQDTVQLAIDAVRRAAPFGDVSRLPKPWKFVETFLFDDDRRFKPRTLDF